MDKFNIIKKPLLTEKSQLARSQNNEYTFEVDRRANKLEIAAALKSIFGVDVESVRTTTKKSIEKTIRGRKSFTPIVKKAIVRLKEGSVIE